MVCKLRLVTSLALILSVSSLCAEPLTRNEALQIAEAFAQHRWDATAKNIRHGLDSAHVEIHTPNVDATQPGTNDASHWTPGASNVGVPYKWGGFDTLESFDAGIKAGKAAGDLYTPELIAPASFHAAGNCRANIPPTRCRTFAHCCIHLPS